MTAQYKPIQYAALAYYHDHRAEIDGQMRAGEAFAEALRQQIPAKVPRLIHRDGEY